jgi:hypothetical protein
VESPGVVEPSDSVGEQTLYSYHDVLVSDYGRNRTWSETYSARHQQTMVVSVAVVHEETQGRQTLEHRTDCVDERAVCREAARDSGDSGWSLQIGHFRGQLYWLRASRLRGDVRNGA